MSRPIAAVIILAGCVPFLAAGQEFLVPGKQAKTAVDYWDAIYLEGNKAGSVHTTVVEVNSRGQKILRTAVDMELTVKRFDQVVEIHGQTGTEEAPDGRVVGTFMKQSLGANKQLTIVGVVKDKQLELVRDGKPNSLKPAPWDARVVGLFKQQSLLADKKPRPGDKFSFLSFEPTVNLVVRMDVLVKEFELIDLLDNKRAQLLRVETTPQKLEGVELPKLVAWVDADWKPVRQDTELPGLGRIAMYRTTKEIALAPAAVKTLTDIGIGALIQLNRKVENPYDSKTALYRITVKGEKDAAAAFSQDSRQKAVNARGATFDLQVTASKGPKNPQRAAKAGDEFTKSSYFITSADPNVIRLARQAIGTEKDPWKKALKIEKWVKANMRPTNTEELAPADHVARTLEGDCTEYAMLMAAMCRAEGVPSRTAIGMLYADTKSGPVMAFHMWTEVWVAGEWIALDATLGRGYVDATHLKVTDNAWHDTRTLTPLLPFMRVVGKTQVEVLSVK